MSWKSVDERAGMNLLQNRPDATRMTTRMAGLDTETLRRWTRVTAGK